MNLSRRECLVSASALALCGPAFAQTTLLSGAPVAPVSGRSTINLMDTTAIAFANFFKSAGINTNTLNPALYNSDGYPLDTGSFAATQTFSVTLPNTYAGNYVMKWSGTGCIQISGIGANGVNIVSGGASVAGLSGADSGTVSNNLSILGANPRVVFNFATTHSGVTCSWLGSQVFTNMANAVFCRAADEAAIDAGNVWNPDFLSALVALKPKTVRTMDCLGTNNSSLTAYANRQSQTAFAYQTTYFLPNLWVGTISGGPDAYTCSGAPSTPGSWTDGETFQGSITAACPSLTVVSIANNGSGLIRVAVADTSRLSTGQVVSIQNSVASGLTAFGIWTITVIDATHFDLQGSTFSSTSINGEKVFVAPTINVASRGAKKIFNSFTSYVGTNFVGGTIAAGAIGTFVYDALLDVVLFYGNSLGLNPMVPVEVQVDLCNRLNTNLWFCLPHLLSDSAVTSFTTYIAANITNGCFFEYSNEVWNSIFAQTGIAGAKGLALGWPATGLQNVYSWYGLRTRQVMGLVTTAWGGKAGLKRVIACQQYFGTSAAINNQYRFQGFNLNSTNFPAYGTYTSGVNYDTASNRPIDFCDVISYARYFSGAQCTNFDVNYSSSNISGLTNAADLFATGTAPNIATALAFLDNDFRAGTRGGVLFSQTLNNQTTVINPQWEAVAAGYTGKTTCDYEGALEAAPPSTNQCTAMGISTTYGGATGLIGNLLTAYKNNSLFQQLISDWITTYTAQAHGGDPGWYTFEGGSQWSMYPTTNGVYSTPFKSYDALAAFNH